MPSLAGCANAGFGVQVHEQLPVNEISATALARGAEIRWTLPDVDPATLEPMLLLFLPESGSVSGAQVFEATGTSLVAGDLDVGVEYRVQLVTFAGREVSPSARVRPFPTGALDPVPWYATSDAIASAGFGASVAFADLDDDEVLEIAIGAPNYGTAASPLQGRVYVHDGATLFDGTAPDVIDGGVALGMFGSSLAPSEDFDADGYGDLLVHAPFPFPPPEVTDTGANPAGVLQVVRGGAAAPFLGPTFSGVSSDFYGASAVGHDFDGDDHADLLAGGPGMSYASVLSSAFGVLFTTTSSGGATRLGFSVAAGDFDDDGFVDLAVGEPLFGMAPAVEDTTGTVEFPTPTPTPSPEPTPSPFLQHRGRVRVYFADGLGGFDPAFTSLVGTTSGQMLGTALAVSDVDQDGVDDLLVGSTTCAIPAVMDPLMPGAISIWEGGGTDSVFTEKPQVILTAATICLGRNVGAGDVNQDGRIDVIAGDSSAGYEGQGEIRAFLGGPDGLPSTYSSAIEGLTPGAGLGRSIAVADFDGDGRAEVLAGAPGSGEMPGAAFLFRGAPRRGPSLDLSADATNLSVALTGQFEPQEGPGVKYTCRWSFGDGSLEEESCDPGTVTTSHVFAVEGTYTVRFRVLSSDDRFGEAVYRLTVGGP